MRVYIETGSQVKQAREHPVIECLTIRILAVCELLGPPTLPVCATSQSSSLQLQRERNCHVKKRYAVIDYLLQTKSYRLPRCKREISIAPPV